MARRKSPKRKSRKKSPRIGPLRHGLLSRYGYSSSDTAKQRHQALEKAAKEYGPGNLVKKLNAICVLNRNRSPSVAKKFCTDKKWVQKTYKTTEPSHNNRPKIYNSETGRYVFKDGKKGKEIMAKRRRKRSV